MFLWPVKWLRLKNEGMKFLLDQDVPDNISYSLKEMGHEVSHLREVLPTTTEDQAVLGYAVEHQLILITCNRDDFLSLAQNTAHHGIIILIRRKNRALERGCLVQLLDKAGENGLRGNINFA